MRRRTNVEPSNLRQVHRFEVAARHRLHLVERRFFPAGARFTLDVHRAAPVCEVHAVRFQCL